MNHDVAQRWVAALRSGKYEQGTHLLRQRYEDGREAFCCLGVLCELYLEDHPESPHKPELLLPYMPKSCSENGDPYGYGDAGTIDLPPDDVKGWADIHSNTCSALAEQNDSGSSFAELADIIEADCETM